MTILTVGIELAKNVFALHGVNEAVFAAAWTLIRLARTQRVRRTQRQVLAVQAAGRRRLGAAAASTDCQQRHSDVATPMIDAHVVERGGGAVRRWPDALTGAHPPRSGRW
ncbi:hypothetical protein WDZ92_36950 [Nostoc sp. NIES-2111]